MNLLHIQTAFMLTCAWHHTVPQETPVLAFPAADGLGAPMADTKESPEWYRLDKQIVDCH